MLKLKNKDIGLWRFNHPNWLLFNKDPDIINNRWMKLTSSFTCVPKNISHYKLGNINQDIKHSEKSHRLFYLKQNCLIFEYTYPNIFLSFIKPTLYSVEIDDRPDIRILNSISVRNNPSIQNKPTNNMKNLFDQYLKTNVQIGIADILEIQSLQNQVNVETLHVKALVGIRDNFDWKKILESIKKSIHGDKDNFNITTHVTTAYNSNDVYMYFWYNSEVVAISLLSTSYTETTATVVATKFINEIFDSFKLHIKDDYHKLNILTVDAQGNIKSSPKPIKRSLIDVSNDAFYPWMTKSLKQDFDDFLGSKETIRILIGPAGTGKSTFSRTMILHSGNPGSLVMDKNTILSNGLLDHFYSNEGTILAIEDADAFIGSRENGNTHISNYLNYADGIFKDTDKKILISTNLSNVSKIDSALLRKGRCFSVENFRLLTKTEANVARESINLPTVNFDKEEITLSEALNYDKTNSEENRFFKVGFTPS